MSDDRVPEERERALAAVVLGAVLGAVLYLLGWRSRRGERLTRRRTG